MANSSSVKFTIHFNDPNLEAEEQNEQVLRLMAELREMGEVDAVNRVPVPSTPKDSRALGGYLVGLLTAEVNVANAKKVLNFLRISLARKPIELAVEANGKKIQVKANSLEELEAAIKAAQDFIAA
ncbi:hypothetical protein ACF3DV_22135 [Chlorogloeopsis fritschii PCC 9212]|uniref:Uncharacterized protein n=1 Tax=Chlorogloeopsis fritschii PCC 6912 TaxID=211165 RepID=A0A3S0XT32_CHLFR|nr:hypothetical protein [Chlorogloeopsis fritschii]RUR76276.1 hypothetical protein PCC6912_44480 [Chlorogloeopsis fritschii PCC 6912]